jgi:hypothetical protein
MDSTQSEPTSTAITSRALGRQESSERALRLMNRRMAGRATALAFGLLASAVRTPEAVFASSAASSDCELRMQVRAMEDVQQRILDRWDDAALFEEDAPEWMRLHRDEWEWLFGQRLETYCPTELAGRADRPTPVRLTLFVRGGGLTDVTGNRSPDAAYVGRSQQYGLVCGAALHWEISP